MTGALLALWIDELPPMPPRIASTLSWAGLAGVVAAILLFSTTTSYPGWRALLPTLGTAAVILSGNGSTAGAARVLATPLLRYFGRVSYSWYLWHWPIAVLGGIFYSITTFEWRAAVVALSLAVGALC